MVRAWNIVLECARDELARLEWSLDVECYGAPEREEVINDVVALKAWIDVHEGEGGWDDR